MLALLANQALPQPALLDAIKFAETGHLSPTAARTATSGKGAVGPYQFMQKFLHDFGYGMPKNIPLADVQDPTKARALADQFITGYSDYHQFKTPLQKLVAYNAGPGFAAQWIANGEDISQLPNETQKYITKAAGYLAQNNNTNQGTQDMASSDGYDDARRAFFTEDQIAQAKRRGIEPQGMIAMRDVAYATDPNKRRQDALPSDIRESRMPTPQQVTAAQQRPNMITRGGVDIHNPQGGNVTTRPGFADFMEGRRLAEQATSNYTQPPIFDYDAIPPALQDNPQFADYMDGMMRANPDVPPAALAQAEVDRITEAERMMAINNPLGGSGNSASLSSAAMASQPPTTSNAPPITSPSQSGPTRNRRDMSMMSLVPPPQQIGLNEALIRIGGAGVRGSAQGGLEAIGSMTDTYGAIQDANRATGLAAYQSQMEALQDGSTAKGREERLEQAGKVDDTLFDMQRALTALESGQDVTGWWDSTVGSAWDDFMGNPEAGTRLLLKKLKVDDALLRVAQTKGAISNNEMRMFLDPAPKETQDEDIWKQWIRDRMVALQNIRQRLATGETVNDPASSQQVNQFAGQNQGNVSLSQDDQSLVNKYL